MPTFPLPQAPATAIIDQNNVLTLSWNPIATIATPFSDYSYWDIVYTVNSGTPQHVQFPAPISYAGGTLTYSQNLSPGVVTLTMAAFGTGILGQLTDYWEPWSVSPYIG